MPVPRAFIDPPPTDLRPGCMAACPGCAHRHLSPEQSRARKWAWLTDALAPWQAQLREMRTVPDGQRWQYRDKVCLSCRWEQGRWQAGLVHRDELIAIPHCPVHSRRVNAALQILLPVMPAAADFPLHYWAQCAAQLTLVVKSAQPPDTGWFRPDLGEALQDGGLEALWLHCYPAAGRHVFAKRGWQLLWGNPHSHDEEGLRYGPTGFQQLIPALYRQALAEAGDFLAPGPDTDVVDLYCGNGTSLRRWLARGARCLGVESGAEAVACARVNAPGAEVLRGRCAQRIPQLQHWLESIPNAGRQRLLYANPPRTGLETEVLHWIIGQARPQRMAYLSCSAGTLRRDLEALDAGGYRLERITPYDFFPQTYHVETLVLLSRQPRSLLPGLDHDAVPAGSS